MDQNVPYMPSVANLHKILDKIQNAGVPEVFNLDFLIDLGFASSHDRKFIHVFKFLGMLDPAGHPQSAYKEFVNHTKAKAVLAHRMRIAFDDLFLSDKTAHAQTAESLKGWFKTKTGASDAVAKKMASQFKALASYANFEVSPSTQQPEQHPIPDKEPTKKTPIDIKPEKPVISNLGLVYRLEIHLPDTQNIETYRAIFRALREELNL